VAVLALVNSQLAAAMGGMVWLVVDIARYGKASALGFASGFIAGLATVTPASGYVGPMGALAIGAAAGLACYGAVMLKGKLGYDDTLDAFGVHGVGGAVGTILLGVFALRAWNPAGADGLLAGNAAFFGKQVLAVGVGVGYAVVGTLVLLKLVDALVGLRVGAEQEHEGLDIHLHGEEGYNMGVGVSTRGHAEIYAESPAEAAATLAKQPAELA
jgi:Amt family ammonium transporter